MPQKLSNTEETDTGLEREQLEPAVAPRPGVCWLFPAFGAISAPDETHVVGRDGSCDTVLEGTQLSRRHAKLSPCLGGFVVEDLRSKNGTFVNGARVSSETIVKPGDVLRLGDCVGCVLSDAPDEARFEALSRGLWGGPTLQRVLEDARRIAASELPVMIEGASGTGKERVARAMHAWSGRQGAFVGVNCAAIPTQLAASELFGHGKGAFTGANQAAEGYFAQAHHGTLLLDELLELPRDIQPMLLRVLEEHVVKPLGSSRAIPVDVRVLVTLQEPLEQAVQDGRVRVDLAARLQAARIRLPPLAERREDIVPLFQQFMREQGGKSASALPKLDATLVESLCLHDWPLNVRELELMAHAMMVRHGHQPVWARAQLPKPLGSTKPNPPAPLGCGVSKTATTPHEVGRSAATTEQRREAEHARLLEALRHTRGNIARAARLIGISRGHAYKLMATYQRDDTP